MPITVEWLSDTQHVLLITHEGTWTWDDVNDPSLKAWACKNLQARVDQP